jgi:hypothetical protein
MSQGTSPRPHAPAAHAVPPKGKDLIAITPHPVWVAQPPRRGFAGQDGCKPLLRSV